MTEKQPKHKKKKTFSLLLGERLFSVFTHFLSDDSLGDNSEALSMMAGTGGDTFSRLCTADMNQHQCFWIFLSKGGRAEITEVTRALKNTMLMFLDTVKL